MSSSLLSSLKEGPCRLWRGLFFLSAAFWLTSCATYSGKSRDIRAFLDVGNYDAAIEKLKPLAAESGKDQLLYQMDLGIAYHASGRYAEAVEVFLKAAELAEIKDYSNLGEEAAAVLLNDEVKPYKGEHFERVLIHVYLAIDFTLQGKWESALVECRRVNHILDKMIAEAKLPYQRNSFAKYLAATLFEAQKEYNDAFVDYRTLLKWSPEYPYLPGPLKRVADKLHASQELEEYKKKYPQVSDYKIPKSHGEVVLVVEQGKIPVKVPHHDFHLLPKFQRRSYDSKFFELKGPFAARPETVTLYDIEATAIKELDERIAGIAAKKIAGVVAKQIVANQVAKHTKSEGLGFLTALFLHATDTADLRSWSTLPARLQLARVAIPAGRHDLALDMVSGVNARSEVKRWTGLEVKPGQTVFLHYRHFN